MVKKPCHIACTLKDTICCFLAVMVVVPLFTHESCPSLSQYALCVCMRVCVRVDEQGPHARRLQFLYLAMYLSRYIYLKFSVRHHKREFFLPVLLWDVKSATSVLRECATQNSIWTESILCRPVISISLMQCIRVADCS